MAATNSQTCQTFGEQRKLVILNWEFRAIAV